MLVSLAWKNVWRNRSRSLTVIASVAVGVFASLFALAAVNSTVVQRISAAVDEELSHIQINNREFRNSSDLLSTIHNADSVAAIINRTPGVSEITRRLVVSGIASSATASAGVEIIGIETDREEQMFDLSQRLIPGTGSYFGAATRLNSAYIGEQLARDLHIIRYILTEESFAALGADGVPATVIGKLRALEGRRFNTGRKLAEACGELLTDREEERWGADILRAAWSYREGARLVISLLDARGNQVSAAFRICGIWHTSNARFEAVSLFVPHEELRMLTGLGEESWHRIIVRLENNNLTDRVTPLMREALPALEVMNWKEIEPDLAMISDYILQIYSIFMIIILAAFSFGIVNTMLMSVLERTRELGMLTAVGMSRRRLMMMIMLESLFLSAVGGFAGMALGGMAIAITGRTGINLVKYSEGLSAMGYSAHLYPTIGADFFVMLTVLIVLTGVLASVYPARRALRLNPVEALRGE